MATASNKKSTRANHGDKAAATVRTFQSAAAPSPFPPIADYAFLSDCHTGALVAPDGTVEWLCPPRFDSPSVFGAILDRSAGGFRVGPSAMGVPAGRRYEPGTMILETTWMTPTGWVLVRDALGIEGGLVRARHRIAKGETRFCALSWSRMLDGPRTAEEAVEALESTTEYWRGWLADADFPDHRWRNHLERSALTLKGLTYAPTGALVAAPTTSLPETPGGE